MASELANMKSLACIVVVFCCQFSSVQGEDWYRWRGPRLNGISVEKDWLTQWPVGGPKMAWKASVGTGFSSVSVSQGRLFTMGNQDNTDTVYCLDARTGKQVWKHSYEGPLGAKYFDGGPTSTPTVDGKYVYTLSRQGDLFCFAAATGKVRWSKNIPKETGAPIPGWGFAGSPLIQDDLLLLNIGEAGTALNKESGKVVWTSATREAGYATPMPYQIGKHHLALMASGKFYISVDLKTGKEQWRHRWLTRFGCNAADPIVAGNQAFICSGYNRGGALLKLSGVMPEVVWKNKEMQTQLNGCVLIAGHLYGIDGDVSTGTKLKCMEWKTGKVKWEYPGSGSLMAADGKLIILSAKGELVVGTASAKAFKPLAKASVLEGKCWTVPVLSNGMIYCRNADGELVCLDVRK